MTAATETDELAATAGAARPRALVVTVYGLYARDEAGWLSVATLIALMGELGVDQAAVRSAISRLKRRGILLPQRRDGAAGYALSDAARRILDAGDRRIFHRPTPTLAEGWVLAVFSIPESERAKRHLLRTRLAWLGFGTVAPGIWVGPAHLLDEARHTLAQDGLSSYVELFVSRHDGFSATPHAVARWWDLEQIAARYDEFSRTWQPALTRWPGGRTGRDDGRDAFCDAIRVVTAWRTLPYLDPGLPPEVLPAAWPGRRAEEIFTTLYRRLERPARTYVESARARPTPGRSR